MKIGIISAYMDHYRRGEHNRGVLQPQIGPLIAGLLPQDADIEIINDVWGEPDWSKDYDLLIISSLHSDFDRARQISHYWRRRGAKTVYGGIMASTYSHLCRPFFDTVVVGDPEGSIPQIYEDFCRGELEPLYVSGPYNVRKIPVPRFDLQAKQQVLPISLEATRGCPFSCDFCVLTGIGTRHHVRPAEAVVRDIRRAQAMLRDRTRWHQRYRLNAVVFADNNIGGNRKYLKQLTEALTPLGIRWGSSITFNVISNEDTVKMLSRSGCRSLYVGLESFNPEAIADMRKPQNIVDEIENVLTLCHHHGIAIESGLMLSPTIDDSHYMQTIPSRLKESGLGVPGFMCFESPIPGTPHFHRLAVEDPPALLPHALLRDFNGYTLVTRPKRESLDLFIDTYKWLLTSIYSRTSILGKYAHDLQRFLCGGHLDTAIIGAGQRRGWRGPDPDRTYVAGTDTPPPEATSVPFSDDDFDSENEHRLILDPCRVTDASGRVLPEWLHSTRVFAPKGRISADALRLTAKLQANQPQRSLPRQTGRNLIGGP